MSSSDKLEIHLEFNDPKEIAKAKKWLCPDPDPDPDGMLVTAEINAMWLIEHFEKDTAPVILKFSPAEFNAYTKGNKPYYMTNEQYVLSVLRYVDYVKNTPQNLFKATDFAKAFHDRNDNAIPF